MAGSAKSGQARGSRDKASGSGKQKGTYVYGIVPADVEVTDEMSGVGDPAGQVRVVASDDLAALVSDVDCSGSFGSPEDLVAHKEILDSVAAEVPVLPLRFGAVLTDDEAVIHELLDAHSDEFAGALRELEDRVQYVVKGRYDEDAILGEVLSENEEMADLREQIRGADKDATRDQRIRLGEMISEAVAAKREEDTRALGDAMEGHCVASAVREPAHELDAVHVAFLVTADQEEEVERVVSGLARDWEKRIELRLLGPMAAYDFVGATEPGA
jgi:hypothetical protein